MKKITVYEIVEKRLWIDDETFEYRPVKLRPFLKEEDASKFIDRCYSNNYPEYRKFKEAVLSPASTGLTYRAKEIEIYDSIEEYDEIFKQERNKAREEEIAKKKAEISQLEDEME